MDILKEFSDLINDKDSIRTIELKGHKFEIKILPYAEMIEDSDIFSKLVKSIVTIDGKEYSFEEKKTLIQNMPGILADELASQISKFYDEYRNKLSDIKKK